ncbi:hypothetical protein HN51_021171 [Arachis hypogaea]|nr:heterogeneous nuclear ribonucleoprotein Q [Arachis duranensis]XP_015947917.1 heterogeneous nuclear ribonucleoprotein Q [Arachis duranensis]XP_025639302.1 heterogeneous nuclear ribonucleoprotein Q [Arachis hypogaea]XP_025639318.1 heterogeneous nuclear ribonucleoprotein Q [Arachis hypogaea]XP_029146952.1 heterogeneous nuclear ribonucleoprotein Q [Arachis hypogaea]QHO52175.1 uncharacterized protein DS421_2g37290 [Arachis hypogaea]QHO52176.1 uncharacterized protein DS421_2g37290 [Arachis hypog
MSEGAEIDERVDFDDENYMEEMDDDDVEEQSDGDDEDDDDDGDGDDNNNDNANDNDDDDDDDDDDGVDGQGEENAEEQEYEDSGEEAGGKDQMAKGDRTGITTGSEGDGLKPPFIDEEEKQKHDELLAMPPHGSEVFIGGLPRDVCEDDLRELCESLGEIFEVRLMKDRDSGEGKGYAFVAFKTKEVAQNAIEEIHNKKYKGKTLRCSLSETKQRLFIGNVPKTWTEEEFRRVVEGVGPGVEVIELFKDVQNPSRNRGFAFVSYYNNACADYSRQKMSTAGFKLEGNTPTVTWADPKNSTDHSAASQVKALYVKNIPENTTTEQLKELFSRHGEVTKVVMPPSKAGGKRDFGFIHYAERSSALKAVKDSEKYEVDGQLLEVVLAKPQAEKKPDMGYGYNPGLAHPGFGGAFAGNPYGSAIGAAGAGYGVAPSFQQPQQPVIYGRGPMPAGMQMVPMVLPDGRIGYVFQQPGVQMPAPRPRGPGRGNSSGGPAGRGGGSGNEGSGKRGRRYQPY